MEHKTRIKIAAASTIAALAGLSAAGLAARDDQPVGPQPATTDVRQAPSSAAPTGLESVGVPSQETSVVTVPEAIAAESPVVVDDDELEDESEESELNEAAEHDDD